MLVCESMDACISICTIVKASIHHSSHRIPSVEFSPTNSLEDEGRLFIHSNPLEQVHIVYTSVTKLLLVERLILLHLIMYLPVKTKQKHKEVDKSIVQIILARIILYNL
jgi:hypothetical protein